MIAEAYGTFHTFYRVREFTIADYEKLLLAVQDKADLIILDHLHFVDSDDPSENRGYKITVKKIRDLAISIGKPVIVVAHVRKGERKNLQLVPTIEDFHGSSDVPKIATRAFMIAPAYDQPNSEPHLWNTYISPQKNRIDGGRCKYSAVVQYNAKVGAYEKVFALGQLDPSHEKFTYTDPAAKDYPAWARRDDQRAQPHWTETAK
jgi:hypothetical protein